MSFAAGVVISHLSKAVTRITNHIFVHSTSQEYTNTKSGIQAAQTISNLWLPQKIVYLVLHSGVENKDGNGTNI